MLHSEMVIIIGFYAEGPGGIKILYTFSFQDFVSSSKMKAAFMLALESHYNTELLRGAPVKLSYT